MKLLTFVAIRLFFFAPLGLLANPEIDRKIQDAAASSYNFRTVLEKQVIVKVESGLVTLMGSVLDGAQKALAEETVREIAGVIAVDNQLKVASVGPGRSDGWITLKIRSMLLLRSDVSAMGTDVTVRDGNVVLAGFAETLAQKELTESYIRGVEGVKSVINRMAIRAVDSAPQMAHARTSLN